MRIGSRLSLIAALVALSAAAATAAVVVAPPVEGWSLPAAVRAVALRSPELALPAGVSLAQISALPLASPVWAVASERLATPAVAAESSPEDMVRRALSEAGEFSARPLSYGYGRLRLGDRAPSAAELERMAPFGAVMPAAARERLRRALARQDARAARVETEASASSQVLAAANADPGLLVSQYATQTSKNLLRPLARYDAWLTLQRFNAGAYSRSDSRDARSRVRVPPAPSLEALARAPSPVTAMLDEQRARHGLVRYADVGGGFGAALREISLSGLGAGVERTLVDLFDWMKLAPGAVDANGALFSAAHRPRLLLSDAAAVSFPKDRRPHVITSIASIQYWPDKIQGIVNLYNQLADGGVLAVATSDTDYPWPNWMSTKGADRNRERLYDDFVQTLVDAGIEVLALTQNAGGIGTITDTYALVLRKKPDARLVSQVRLDSARAVGKDGYVRSVYERGDGLAPVRVESAGAR